jgi:hypothetical protein
MFLTKAGNKSQKAFTLLEIVFSSFIVMLLTGVFFVSFRGGAATNDLKRSVSRVALELRRAQNAALNTTLLNNEAPFGYGIYFSLNNPDEIIMFADLDDDKTATAGEFVETIKLERGVSIVNLSPSSPLVVFFRSPEPKTFINTQNSGSASVTLRLQSDLSQTKNININISGQIDIQ